MEEEFSKELDEKCYRKNPKLLGKGIKGQTILEKSEFL